MHLGKLDGTFRLPGLDLQLFRVARPRLAQLQAPAWHCNTYAASLFLVSLEHRIYLEEAVVGRPCPALPTGPQKLSPNCRGVYTPFGPFWMNLTVVP